MGSLPLIVATLHDALMAPVALVLLLGFGLARGWLRRPPAVGGALAAPVGFAAPTSGKGPGSELWFGETGWGDTLLAFVPGLLPAVRGLRRNAAECGVIGWGGLVGLVAIDDSSGWGTLFVFGYVFACIFGALSTLPIGAEDRWLRWTRNVNEEMRRAEVHLPSCPRCRGAERLASGWCASCLTTLRSGELDPSDWRAHVGSRHAVDRDPTLAARCRPRIACSYFGAGGERYPVGGRRTDATAADATAADATAAAELSYENRIEAAYRDPQRPELVWVRAHERNDLSTGGSYGVTRVEAWGFVEDRLTHRWVFAPLRVVDAAAADRHTNVTGAPGHAG